jgi:hypothetical protein
MTGMQQLRTFVLRNQYFQERPAHQSSLQSLWMTKTQQIPAVPIRRPEHINWFALFPYEGELFPVIQFSLKSRFINTLQDGDVVIAPPERLGSVDLEHQFIR